VELKLEYLGEDREFAGSKKWSVEAIHVTTTRNKRRYTESELIAAARSLSFRPININHDPNQTLPFPENCTLFMDFDSTSKSVKGEFRITDNHTNTMIEANQINKVSIEQLPTNGETCNEISCEQHGVAFIGMALLESDMIPGDENANIRKESYTLNDLYITDGQRTCTECTDFEMCNSCKHNTENDKCVKDCLSAKKAKGITINDQVIATCISECGKTNKKEVWTIYKKFEYLKD
jgi:hypothetical protein